MANIKPIKSKLQANILSADQIIEIKAGTLDILETVGVHFPSARALSIFGEHGAQVDTENQIVRLSPDLVLEAMNCAPRSYTLSGRAKGTDLNLDGASSYFSTDGCGTETIDLKTGEYRRSCKNDVGMMARVADALSAAI